MTAAALLIALALLVHAVPARAPASGRLDRAPADAGLPLALDLIAVALRSGATVPDALTLAAPAAQPATAANLCRVGALLRLGADPDEAWGVLRDRPGLAAVAGVAVRSSASGARLATAFEQLAVDVRAELDASAQVRAQRAGVVAMAPLGLCFLPAFVCVGVIPSVVGITRSAFPGRA